MCLPSAGALSWVWVWETQVRETFCCVCLRLDPESEWDSRCQAASVIVPKGIRQVRSVRTSPQVFQWQRRINHDWLQSRWGCFGFSLSWPHFPRHSRHPPSSSFPHRLWFTAQTTWPACSCGRRASSIPSFNGGCWIKTRKQSKCWCLPSKERIHQDIPGSRDPPPLFLSHLSSLPLSLCPRSTSPPLLRLPLLGLVPSCASARWRLGTVSRFRRRNAAGVRQHDPGPHWRHNHGFFTRRVAWTPVITAD